MLLVSIMSSTGATLSGGSISINPGGKGGVWGGELVFGRKTPKHQLFLRPKGASEWGYKAPQKANPLP